MEFLKGAIIFMVGGAVGATGAVLFVKEKNRKELDREINELRKKYNEKKENEIEKKEYDQILKDNKYISYDSMGKKNKNNEEVRKRVNILSDDCIEKESPPEDYPTEPFEISEEDYSEYGFCYEKVEADYYLGDGALVDDGDEMLNIEDCVGFENIEKFIKDDKSEVMFIRNIEFGIDYMIHKAGGNYSDIIGVGGDDED